MISILTALQQHVVADLRIACQSTSGAAHDDLIEPVIKESFHCIVSQIAIWHTQRGNEMLTSIEIQCCGIEYKIGNFVFFHAELAIPRTFFRRIADMEKLFSERFHDLPTGADEKRLAWDRWKLRQLFTEIVSAFCL
ncbi:hypothetical protein D512_25793 [Burkholderia pseudomallei MSHR1043]|nr:hypothetical protein D512_25793 [Burkholderia pseudomallei MSHR1043]KGC58435.1 hypothetical protein DP56_5448 [Burkholderia pseudomallei]KGS27696.1 hypothetical protein X989_1905 [Burkholderia pseudomallei MSHR4378]KGS87268.1 hypothetical protein X976_4436 [Burkholderia pseudomallei MSHR7500]KGW43454.1 hypothetical protein Y597_4905 [Burkholderia pseudomallei MSHR1000]KGX62526.1 hypothetical protein Y027_2034 [Burkholderia pseudomallei TSV5]